MKILYLNNLNVLHNVRNPSFVFVQNYETLIMCLQFENPLPRPTLSMSYFNHSGVSISLVSLYMKCLKSTHLKYFLCLSVFTLRILFTNLRCIGIVISNVCNPLM